MNFRPSGCIEAPPSSRKVRGLGMGNSDTTRRSPAATTYTLPPTVTNTVSLAVSHSKSIIASLWLLREAVCTGGASVARRRSRNWRTPALLPARRRWSDPPKTTFVGDSLDLSDMRYVKGSAEGCMMSYTRTNPSWQPVAICNVSCCH